MISLRLSSVLAALIFSLSALPSRAQTAGPFQYRLENTSAYTEGCYPPCLCPITWGGVVSGSYVLQFSFSDPAGYDNYLVSNVDWRRELGGVTQHITGSGQYKRGGAVAVQEQLTLDLSQNGAAPQHFDSGLVTPQGVFPRIEIAISINGMFCFDTVYDIVSAPDPGVPYCFGDGTGTACPCGNAGAAGNGCASSVNAAGANMSAVGAASLSADGVVLIATGMPDAPTLFFQGTQRTNGGAGLVFGDGLQCASGTIARLKIVQALAGEARVPTPVDPPLSLMGGIFAPGTYDYQAWHRDAPVFCTSATFNLTNGYEISWTP